MVAVGSSNLIGARIMTCSCAMFTVFYFVTATNLSVTGVE